MFSQAAGAGANAAMSLWRLTPDRPDDATSCFEASSYSLEREYAAKAPHGLSLGTRVIHCPHVDRDVECGLEDVLGCSYLARNLYVGYRPLPRTRRLDGSDIAMTVTHMNGLRSQTRTTLHRPRTNRHAEKLGIELTEEGYIKHDNYRTNVPGIYTAGDVAGGFKQIVTAAGQGSEAATVVFEDLIDPYWK